MRGRPVERQLEYDVTKASSSQPYPCPFLNLHRFLGILDRVGRRLVFVQSRGEESRRFRTPHARYLYTSIFERFCLERP